MDMYARASSIRYTAHMSNLHVLTGENAYLLLREKRRWIDEFTRKHGSDNVLRTEGTDATVRSLLDEVSTAPFLAEKRLVVVNGMVRCTKEEARLLTQSIHPDVLVLMVDPKPDKRSGGIKELLAIAGKNARECAVLKGAALARWMESFVRERKGSMQPAARDRLMEWNGTDMGMIVSELEKLLTVSDTQSITLAMVEQYCTPSDEGIIWTIGDLLYAGSRDKAILYARNMLECGSDPYGMWSMLLSLLKNLVAVRAALDAKVPPAAIPTECDVHPFVVRSMSGYCRRLDRNALHALLSWAAEEDVHLKTGAYRSTQDTTEEILALLDSFLLRLPK
jgi:DNA polymerase III subunit delta